jgi:hypothetical protein
VELKVILFGHQLVFQMLSVFASINLGVDLAIAWSRDLLA